MRVLLSSTSWLGEPALTVALGDAAAVCASTSGAAASRAEAMTRVRRLRFMGFIPWGRGGVVGQLVRRVGGGSVGLGGIGCTVTRLGATAAEHVFADQLDQVDRGLGHEDLVAGLERLRVAARGQADVAFAQQAAGEDAGGGIARQVLELVVDRQGHDRVVFDRVHLNVGHVADRDAADLDRRVRAQRADRAETRLQLVGVAAEAPLAVGGGERQHQQRGQGEQQERADGEFDTGCTDTHSGNSETISPSGAGTDAGARSADAAGG